MKKINFIFGIHCHQPIGNPPEIIEEAYQKAYLPFLETMERHPKIKFTAHFSGILFDYFMDKHPEFMELLKKLIKTGQIEILTGGYFEPIFSLIPEEDQLGQINLQSAFIRGHFNQSPSGIWLSERIWDPAIIKNLVKAGIDYTIVDDYHFKNNGLPKEESFGYHITESGGQTLKVFHINNELRHLIPFKLPEEAMKFLLEAATEEGNRAAVLIDDGERFGMWPGTHKWVYGEHYLERILSAIESNSAWLKTLTFSQYLDEFPARGRIYIPPSSYEEMMQWSGGYFRNFFIKYPEANNMHKKMLQVSSKLRLLEKGKSLWGKAEDKSSRLKEAEIELYKGQCNCAYWHGLFGGIYLGYLREAVYEHLIKAEVLAEKFMHGEKSFIELSLADFDKDGAEEVLISNDFLNLYVNPQLGGSIFELDYKPKTFNLVNSLTRKKEPYHEKTKKRKFYYDPYQRASLIDHFLAQDTEINRFKNADYNELGNFAGRTYSLMPRRSGNEVSLFLEREGQIAIFPEKYPFKITKNILLYAGQSIISIAYGLENLSEKELELWFGVEFNFPYLSDEEFRQQGENENVREIKIVDESLSFSVSLESQEEMAVWRVPIEAWINSEKKMVKSFQGAALLPHWRFNIKPREKWQNKLVVRIES